MTVAHNDTHTHEQFLQMSVGLGLGLVFVHLFKVAFCLFFWFSLEYLVIPPYGSMGGYLVHCVYFFVILFVCKVTDFSAVERAKDVKFCMHVGLLSGQVFSQFGGPRSKVKVTRVE